MDKSKNILIEKYLEQHSLVESNIRSFNNFIHTRIKNTIDEVNENLNNDDVEVKFGRVRLGKPNIVEADGSLTVVTPTMARLRSLTYAAPVFVELTVKFDNQVDTTEVEIGRIP